MQLPVSIRSGELTICGVTLRCHVLDDGQRVIEEEGVRELFAAFERGMRIRPEDSEALARFVAMKGE